MEPADRHPALERIRVGHGDILGTLGDDLTASDLSSLLLGVSRNRAGRVMPVDVLRRYERDRFVAPGAVDALALHDAEGAALRAVSDRFSPIVLSPLVPFATHTALAGVAQDNVVTTIRSTEVAADPTTALALEAAAQRSRSTIDASTPVTRLAGVSRVVRTQRFDGPRSFSHFSLLGMVSAGRDRGSHRFESDEMTAHVAALVDVVRAWGTDRVVVRLTDLEDAPSSVLDDAADRLGPHDVVVERWPERQSGRGYYEGFCFKLAIVTDDGEHLEVGDGGFVDWTQRLLGNRKERLMTSAVSTERLAMLPRG